MASQPSALTHTDMFRLGDEIPVWVETLRAMTAQAAKDRRIKQIVRDGFNGALYAHERLRHFHTGRLQALEVWELLRLQNALFMLPQHTFPVNQRVFAGRVSAQTRAKAGPRKSSRKPAIDATPTHSALAD